MDPEKRAGEHGLGGHDQGRRGGARGKRVHSLIKRGAACQSDGGGLIPQIVPGNVVVPSDPGIRSSARESSSLAGSVVNVKKGEEMKKGNFGLDVFLFWACLLFTPLWC